MIVVRGASNFNRCFYTEDTDWDDIASPEEGPSLQTHVTRHLMADTSGTRHSVAETKSSGTRRRAADTADLRPSGADFGSPGEEDARELFDEFTASEQPIKNMEIRNVVKNLRQVKSNSTESLVNSDSTREEKLSPNFTNSKIDELNNVILTTNAVPELTYNLNAFEGLISEKHNRISRALRSALDPADGSDEKTVLTEDQAWMLTLLHTVNDTRDVTAGNSSVSSSEEFMEQCKDTIVKIDVMPFVDCQSRNMSQQLETSFRVNETDEYYIIFMSDNSIEENVIKYYLELNQVLYNISSSTESCSNATDCWFPLRFMGNEVVVVEMNEPEESGPLKDLHSYELHVVCQPRVVVYMIFILLVPFVILLFAFQ